MEVKKEKIVCCNIDECIHTGPILQFRGFETRKEMHKM